VRPAAATLAAILGVVAALTAAVLWTGGRNVLDADRFASRTVAALHSTPGRAALTQGISAQIRSRAPAIPRPEVDTAVERAVDAVAADPAFAPALTGALTRAHRAILENPDEPIEVDLAALRTLVARELETRDPRLVALLPPAPELEGARVSTGLRVPAIPGSRLAGHVPALVALLALGAALLLALAIVASDRSGRTARRIGAALIALSPVPAAIGLLVPRAAEAAVSPPDDELARDLAERLLASWPGPALALFAAGAAIVALSLIRGGEGPRIRTRGA
jgi:hypothetical protein